MWFLWKWGTRPLLFVRHSRVSCHISHEILLINLSCTLSSFAFTIVRLYGKQKKKQKNKKPWKRTVKHVYLPVICFWSICWEPTLVLLLMLYKCTSFHTSHSCNSSFLGFSKADVHQLFSRQVCFLLFTRGWRPSFRTGISCPAMLGTLTGNISAFTPCSCMLFQIISSQGHEFLSLQTYG